MTSFGPPGPYGNAPTSPLGPPTAVAPYGPAPYGSTPHGPPPYGPPTAHQPPPGPPPRRRGTRWLLVTAIVAVLALGAGAIYAITLLTGRGGAATANEAVTLMARDLEGGDTLDALGLLHPAERTLATDSRKVLTDELVRLEIIRPGADPTTMNATVTGLRFDETAAETVRDDVVITKLVGGTIRMETDPARSPFTDRFRDLVSPRGAAASQQVDIARDVPEGIRVASVRVDGRWYVSAFYTAADYALRSAGTPWPRTSVAARGADSATEALKQTVQATLDMDVRRLIELAPPSELQVLHDVGDALISSAGRTTPSGVRLLDLATTQKGVAGGTGLQVQKIVLQNDDGDVATISREGSCIVASTRENPRQQRICSFADFASAGGGRRSGSVTGDPTLDRVLAKLFPVVTNPVIVTVQDGGTFYVSPFRTIVQLYGDVLGALDAQDVRDLVTAAKLDR